VLCKHDVIGSNPFRSTIFISSPIEFVARHRTLECMIIRQASRPSALRQALLILSCFCGMGTAHSGPVSLAEKLSQELISQAVPTADEVAPFRESDFQVRWLESAPSGARMELVRGSLTWVRVGRLLVLPRARVRIGVDKAEAVQLQIAGSIQQIPSQGGEAPVSLFSGRQELTTLRAGKVSRHPFEVVFSPSSDSSAARLSNRIFVDASCSPHRVEVTHKSPFPSSQWAFVACRLVYSRSGENPVPQLEVHVGWAGVQPPVAVGGIPQDSSSGSTHAAVALLSSEQPRVTFRDSSGVEFELRAQLPRQLKTAFLGVGLGPYSYLIQVPGLPTVQTIAPITTLYGSYFLAEGSRMVFFDAFPVHGEWYNDFGLYFNNESSRALDERLSVHLLLGFHLISFKSPLGIQHRLGAPQGFEMIYRDAFGRRNNVSVGGFFYPPIAGKAYYNTWLRIGSPKVFGELNYLSWRELSGDGNQALSRSVGISVGAPLLFL
jgi:hypothetical protein